MVNAVFSYISIKRLTSEIQVVREELLRIPRGDDGARNVLQFYQKLGNIVLIVLIHLLFIGIFLVVLNVTFVHKPEFAWPFYACSVISYPALGAVPLVFWHSGGRFVDDFATDYETSALATAISMRL